MHAVWISACDCYTIMSRMNTVHDRHALGSASRRQAGDTIVEVIIAVAVVATILAGAFTVTTRSTRTVRDSEEHAEALQYLQQQVELLRAVAAQPGKLSGSPFITTGFCLDANLNISQQGKPACAAGNIPYALSIVAPTGLSASGTTDFSFTATWPALGGGTDTVYLAYKVVAS